VALGYWISRLQAGAPFLNVSFASVNERVPNLGCFRNGGLYRQPTGREVVIHRVKGAAGMAYVWRRLHNETAHDPLICARDAEIELPRGSLVFRPDFMARVRSGTVTLEFDQKSRLLKMHFARASVPATLPATLPGTPASTMAGRVKQGVPQGG
jgi:hypothetical protein